MGRGLSKYQRAILKRLEERGSLDIRDVDDIVWSVRLKGDPQFELLRAIRAGTRDAEVKSILNYASLYRMMRSLVRRGLAGRVLHVRPTLWVHLEGGGPSARAIRSRAKILGLIRRGELFVEIGNEAYRFGLGGSAEMKA